MPQSVWYRPDANEVGSERGQEMDIPPISIVLAGSYSHTNNALCIAHQACRETDNRRDVLTLWHHKIAVVMPYGLLACCDYCDIVIILVTLFVPLLYYRRYSVVRMRRKIEVPPT